MSVDLYAVMPLDDWPEIAQIQKCASGQGYPITLERFPSASAEMPNEDGALIEMDDGLQAYLEGSLFRAVDSPEDVAALNQRIENSANFIGGGDAIWSIHTRSLGEIRAASYLVSSLITCFGAFGFEPQGDTSGRDDFAKQLVEMADRLEGNGS